MRRYFHTEAKLGFANTSENTTKSSFIKFKKESAEISLELVNNRLPQGFDLRPKDYESHTLTTQPRTLNKY